MRLERNYRSGARILEAARAVVEPCPERIDKKLTRRAARAACASGAARSERAQAQAVAAEVERLVARRACPPTRSACSCARRRREGAGDRLGAGGARGAVPADRLGRVLPARRGARRARLAAALADPDDSGAVVRALSRPPIELRSVDVARLTQLARRRKLDMPSAVVAALEGPQLSPEGRDRAQAFLRLYRAASSAFEDRRPDAFVLRLIERIGLRRQQVFATQADTVERLRNIAKLAELATAYMRREPQATARDFTRYLAAVAESGLREEEATRARRSAGRARDDDARREGPGVRPRLRARALGRAHARPLAAAGRRRARRAAQGAAAGAAATARRHEAEMRRLLHVAMTRARKGLVLAWAEGGDARRDAAAVAVLRGGARGARGRGGGLRGGAVRAGRGPALDVPDHARRAARHASPASAAGSARCASTPTSTSTRRSRATSS